MACIRIWREIEIVKREKENNMVSHSHTAANGFTCRVRRLSATVRQQLPQMKFTTSEHTGIHYQKQAPVLCRYNHGQIIFISFCSLLFWPLRFGLIDFLLDIVCRLHFYMAIDSCMFIHFLYHPPTPTTPTLSECNS